MLTKDQFEALLKVMPTLTHYQMLKVSPTASREDIQKAFHREALSFHPDLYQGLKDPELLQLAKTTYSRIVEAYTTLTHHSKREDYDRKANIHIIAQTALGPVVDENEITSAKAKKPAIAGAGLKFYTLAKTSFQQGQLASAKMNIQLALNSDAQNPDYKHLLQKIEAALAKSAPIKKPT